MHPGSFTWKIITIGGLMAATCANAAPAGTVYFQVAERPGQVVHQDSYILPLTNADDITHARQIIELGPEKAGSSIVFAKIAAGRDGLNRDLLTPERMEWSWHVTEFQGFGDVGIELIDGWPTHVEQNLNSWLRETNGQIGFWNYTPVRELTGYPDAPPNPAVPLPSALPAAILILLFIAIGSMLKRGRRWWV